MFPIGRTTDAFPVCPGIVIVDGQNPVCATLTVNAPLPTPAPLFGGFVAQLGCAESWTATPSGFCPRRKMPRSVFVWVVQPTAGSRKFAEKAGAPQPNCVVTDCRSPGPAGSGRSSG